MTQKKVNNAWVTVSIIALALLVVFAGIAIFKAPKEIVPEGYLSPSEVGLKLNNAINNITSEKDVQIAILQNKIVGLENRTTESGTEETNVLGYLIDKLELKINDIFGKEGYLTDKEISKLVDSEVELNDEDVDYQELLYIGNVTIDRNGDAYNGDVYMSVKSDEVKYLVEFEFDDKANISDINSSDDEYLEFSFLGKDVKISSWTCNGDCEVTLSKGKDYNLKPNDEIVVGNKTLKILSISDDEVFVEVDGIGRSIKEDYTKTVNDIEINVKDCFESETYSIVVLKVGEEVKEIIYDGDFYDEDEYWKYEITNKSIGVKLAESYDEELDEDELNVIGVGNSLCLPNDYVCVQFNGIEDEDVEEVSFDYDASDKELTIVGDFNDGDYDKITFVLGDSNFTTEDEDGDEVNASEFNLGDSDVQIVLNISTETITIDDVVITYNSTIGKIVNITSDKNVDSDEDYRTINGSIVKDSEKFLEDMEDGDDGEFSIVVPYEQLKASISVI